MWGGSLLERHFEGKDLFYNLDEPVVTGERVCFVSTLPTENTPSRDQIKFIYQNLIS